jgi:hypothetical protein
MPNLFHPIFFTGQLFIPNGAYSGQKLTKLVRTKTAPNTNKTTPNVPVTVPVKYKAAKIMAKMTRVMRSAEPMFFFMTVRFLVKQIFKQPNRTK